MSRTFPVAEVVPEALLALGAVHETPASPRRRPRATSGCLTPGRHARRGPRRWPSGGWPTSTSRRTTWSRPATPTSAPDPVSANLRLPEVKPGRAARGAGRRPSWPASRWPRSRPTVLGPQIPCPSGPALACARRRAAGRCTVLTAAGRAARAAVEPGVPGRGDQARPLDPATGEPRWTADLGARGVWVGYLADKLLAATSTACVVALDPTTGAEQWRFAARQPARDRDAGPIPSPATSAAAAGPDAARAALHDFQLVGGRLFCLRGDAGADLRSRRRHRLGRLVVLAARRRDQPQALDRPGADRPPGPEAQSARRAGDRQRPPGRADCRWPRAKRSSGAPVPIDDDHVLLVPGPPDGQEVRSQPRPVRLGLPREREMPVNGPPRVLVGRRAAAGAPRRPAR